ncbi:DUF1513 domain-containing protein [Paracandidimonas lactea]|uniref:DUF1513 domain-containing protein n=1 Tax=Paracandidimonas lactea TaxID=2895524 RepID=UPI001F30A9B9|nr:DUF1513 domain-containing protein [Paracandidimonas lactea]
MATDRRRFLGLFAASAASSACAAFAGRVYGAPAAILLAAGADASTAKTASMSCGPASRTSTWVAGGTSGEEGAHSFAIDELPLANTSIYMAARKQAGRYQVAVFDAQGCERMALPLPARGHSFAIDAPRGRAVAFGRQPGFYAVAFSYRREAAPVTLRPAPGRHFFGHGVFSPDGTRMVSTENDYEAGRGVLGIYDASTNGGYRRVGEYASGGVGPHEVILMPDGHTLCVANGGILTHPDYGKLPLNAGNMRPSLAYVDLHTGKLLELHELDPALNRLSIRHLALDGSGAVWFGCQHTGPAHERPPLVGRHRPGTAPVLFEGPGDVQHRLSNYVGSVASDASGRHIATSSPVGGIVAVWDIDTGRCIGAQSLFDGCGVAPAGPQGFLLSSGQGRLAQWQEVAAPIHPVRAWDDTAWDNHLRQVPASTS